MAQALGWMLAAMVVLAALPAGAQAPGDAAGAATAINAFGWDLYQRQEAGQNVFYSPYSASQALGMLYLGARAETRAQMARVLHLGADEAAWQAGNQALAALLVPKTQPKGEPFALSSVNAAFSQTGYPFLPEYLDAVKAAYVGANLRELDFAGNTDAARATINGWVSEQTNKGIPELIPDGVLTVLTRLVLANAVYFKASWLRTFDPKSTVDADFTKADGATVRVRMMRQAERYRYAEGDGYQAVALPYVGGQVSALVLLPAKGRLADLEKGLDSAKLASLLQTMGPRQVMLSLPRFALSQNLPLKQNLMDLGMTDAFIDQRADLSGIDGKKKLYVTAALHKAFAKVDEQGTEAGAATAVVVGERSYPGPPVTMTCDRPFLFLVRENTTGAILFMGRVADPTT